MLKNFLRILKLKKIKICYKRTALVNQSEDIPGMHFLNSAFDSSTFIRTNYNYMQTFAAAAVAQNTNALSSSTNLSNNNATNRTTHLNNPSASICAGAKSSSIVIGIGPANSTSNLMNSAQSANIVNNHISSKSSISTNHLGGGSSISSKTAEGRTLWLQNLAAAAANNVSSKRAYCSKTQMYCEAVSRALDMPTCKVVPFFGAFLHDLRFIIESVPSVTVMCNKNIQKPIEVNSEAFIFSQIPLF